METCSSFSSDCAFDGADEHCDTNSGCFMICTGLEHDQNTTNFANSMTSSTGSTESLSSSTGSTSSLINSQGQAPATSATPRAASDDNRRNGSGPKQPRSREPSMKRPGGKKTATRSRLD